MLQIGARTLRPRIHRQLPEFLREFPPLPSGRPPWPETARRAEPVEWEALITEVLTRCDPGQHTIMKSLCLDCHDGLCSATFFQPGPSCVLLCIRGSEVPEVHWITPGEAAARAALDGPQGFLTANRLKLYSDKRNDPATPQVLSDLSPYLHYGQLAPQRAALEAAKHRPK